MIWLNFTADTKILGAFRTSYTISSHVKRSFLTHNLPNIILLIFLYLPLYKIHYVSTSAFNKVRIFRKKLLFLVCLNRYFLLLIHKRIKFILLYILSTSWTPYLQIQTQFINGIYNQAFFMNFMKALRGLKHNNILIIKIVILQEHAAEFAVIFIHR